MPGIILLRNFSMSTFYEWLFRFSILKIKRCRYLNQILCGIVILNNNGCFLLLDTEQCSDDNSVYLDHGVPCEQMYITSTRSHNHRAPSHCRRRRMTTMILFSSVFNLVEGLAFYLYLHEIIGVCEFYRYTQIV